MLKLALALMLTLVCAFGATAQAPPAQITVENPSISLEAANAAIAAAKQKAEQLGIKENICIVDAGANLKAFERMDGAWLGSIDIALIKAKTARWFDLSTAELGEKSQPGESLYSIQISNGGVITFPGGVPLKDANGVVIGAIGCSGSTVENDQACALAGVQAISK